MTDHAFTALSASNVTLTTTISSQFVTTGVANCTELEAATL